MHVRQQFDSLEVDSRWSFADLTPSETGKWTHCYHRYPAKFIPQLVEALLDEYSVPEDAHVNDPFMGSGTTIVTAVSRGMKASGTDINRLAYLITKVKSTPIEPEYLARKVELFLGDVWLALSPEEHLFVDPIYPYVPSKHRDRIEYWFRPREIEQLGKILSLIYEEKDDRVRDFLLVAFSHILKPCSLWSPESTKPARDTDREPADPGRAIEQHLMRMLRGNASFYHVVPEKVKANLDSYLNIRVGDARSQPVASNSVDIIISSSPYSLSYEYADLHELSTIWLELTEDIQHYKRQFIGSAHRSPAEIEPKSETASDIVRRLEERSSKSADDVLAFFLDMQQVIEESYRILKPGGRCCYVIGNTTLLGVDILNAEVFAELMVSTGFSLERVIKREIPSKILPQGRDSKTGRFSSEADTEAYPVEYIVIAEKPTETTNKENAEKQ